MSRNIKAILLRGILNSCGKLSVEAEIALGDGSKGKASVPVAIKPGRREKTRSQITTLGRFDTDDNFMELMKSLKNLLFETQEEFDVFLNSQTLKGFGADITLALSLAFARAMASSEGLSFVQYLASLGNFQPRIPHPIINIFSGGIHGHTHTVPFQQIMIIPNYNTLYEDVDLALHIYEVIERRMKEKSLLDGYSASSGMLVKMFDYKMLLEEIAEQIIQLKISSHIFLGMDIAAEHLKLSNGRYQFVGKSIDGNELLMIYHQLITQFGIKYIEDPFDSADVELWQELNKTLGKEVLIVGDDLFATNPEHIVRGIANGILLKMNQVGTLSTTVKAALTAKAYELCLCLSHRSCETEDTAMCDLAVALGVNFIKVGGPRRGDRIIKYNQLLRLAEDFENLL